MNFLAYAIKNTLCTVGFLAKFRFPAQTTSEICLEYLEKNND